MTPNSPELWREHLPARKANHHKYDRGYALVMAAPRLLGATRLAATAALRVGTGLVGVVARGEPGWALRASLPADILVLDNVPEKATALLGGSGGIDPERARTLLWDSRPRVLDADLLTPELLDANLSGTVLTPHAGEFARVFGADSTPDNAAKASARTGAVVVLKGPTTWVAAPDGRLSEHARPNANLAVGGTGDVLAGAVAGLLSAGMPPWGAASAAVWLHGRAAEIAGAFLSASDLVEALRPAVAELYATPPLL